MAVPDHPARNEYFDDFSDDLLAKQARAPLDEMPASTFESSNVHSALYDFGERELVVRYKRQATDTVYQYRDVPAKTWQGLQAAGSKGSFINANVAYEFRYAKVGRDELMRKAEERLGQGAVRRFLTWP
jgi:hypothetical protein